jgi:hypothetical protein
MLAKGADRDAKGDGETAAMEGESIAILGSILGAIRLNLPWLILESQE